VGNVGVTHDTAEFGGWRGIRRWWRWDGKKAYPAAQKLPICADGGGSNGSRRRAWKATYNDWQTTSCSDHGLSLSPGTSKWNKIEHRLFSFISLNWKGQPLVSYEAIINLIGSTRTRTGTPSQGASPTPKSTKRGLRVLSADSKN